MSAQNTDKLRKSAERFSTNLAGALAQGADTINLNSVATVPTGTAVTIVIDRVDRVSKDPTPDKFELAIGVISGSSLVTCIRGVAGADQAHDDGALVEFLPTATDWNSLIDWALTRHNQDGTHQAFTESNIVPTAAIQDEAVTEAKIADEAVTQAKAPFALAGKVNNMKMDIVTAAPPSYNGLAAGTGTTVTVTFGGLSSVYACYAIPQKGAGGSNCDRLTFSTDTQLPSAGNAVVFRVFNNGAAAAFMSGVTYIAIGT